MGTDFFLTAPQATRNVFITVISEDPLLNRNNNNENGEQMVSCRNPPWGKLWEVENEPLKENYEF